MRTKIFLLLITITLVGCNNKMKISPGTYEAVAMGGTHPVKQDSSYSYKASFAKSMENLIRNLISALNGEAYEEAKAITDQIIATGDEELIKQAEYINSVL